MLFSAKDSNNFCTTVVPLRTLMLVENQEQKAVHIVVKNCTVSHTADETPCSKNSNTGTRMKPERLEPDPDSTMLPIPTTPPVTALRFLDHVLPRDEMLMPVSPIRPSSDRILFRDLDISHTGNERRTVRALPMSPALFITKKTSTPVPSTPDMGISVCQSAVARHGVFSFADMCRICHEDGSKEKLVSPCHCAGTVGMLHFSCLEKWLGTSRTTRCEICRFEFTVTKKPKPLIWYLTEPSLRREKCILLKDISLTGSFSLLSVIVIVLCWLFAERLLHENKVGPGAALILCTMFIIIMYVIWLLFAVRRIKYIFTKWHRLHYVIHIKQEHTEHEISNKIIKRFPVCLRTASKHKKTNCRCAKATALSNSYISYSLESYKLAMFNPVDPANPLLSDNNNDYLYVDENTLSVVSLDEHEECLSYYQPPQSGTTLAMSTMLEDAVKETSV